MATLQRMTTCLWFDKEAEEAARYYTGIFSNSRIGRITRYGKEGYEVHHMPEGTVLTVEFWLGDYGFLAMNGGPQFKFSQAISFIITCSNQEEVDYYWEKLTAGGAAEAQMCGWLKDKYGLSWQVVPDTLPRLMADPDPVKSGKVMKALLQMKKLDVAALDNAYNS